MKHIISKTENQQVIDTETGELVENTTRKTFIVSKQNEPFLLTYVKGLSIIYGIKSPTALRLLFKLLSMSQFNNPVVSISSPDKKDIMEELGISISSYTKGIDTLIKSGLISGGRGRYTISEEIFWRGDSKTRQKLLDCKNVKPITMTFENNDIEPNKDFDNN